MRSVQDVYLNQCGSSATDPTMDLKQRTRADRQLHSLVSRQHETHSDTICSDRRRDLHVEGSTAPDHETRLQVQG